MNVSKSTLESLFDSKVRVKILKFLFRNTGLAFSAKDVSSRIQERPSVVKREIRKLLDVGLLKHINK